MQRHYAMLRLPLSEDGERATGIITLDVFGSGWNDPETAGSGLYPRVD